MKRFWAIFLSLLMILTLLPAVAITASAETIDIAAAKVATSGTSVTVGGWVVYRYGAADTVDTYVLEDYSGTDSSINALIVYAGATAGSTFLSASSLSVGDYVEVTGTVGAFGTVPQLTSPTITAATAPTGKTCPAAQVMTFAQLAANAAEYVGELVCIEGVTLGTYAASGNTTMTDSTGSLSAYKAASYAAGVAAGDEVTLYASYGLYSTTYQLRVGYRATAGDAYIKEALSYTVSAQSNNAAYGTVEAASNIIYATPATGYMVDPTTPYTIVSGSATVAQDGNTFIVTATADVTVQINFVARTAYTVNFIANGTTAETRTVYDGDALGTLPTTTDLGSYCFQGWMAGTITGSQSTAPAYITTATIPTASVDYYAVYGVESSGGSENAYKLASSAADLTVGSKYLIVAIASSNYFAAGAPNANGDTYLKNVAITAPVDDVITIGTELVDTFTLGGTAEGYSFTSTSQNAAFGWKTGGKNTINYSATGNYALWTITIDSTSFAATVNNKGETTRNLQYNSSNPRFSTYTSGQTSIYLYKQNLGAVSGFCTTVDVSSYNLIFDANTVETTANMPATVTGIAAGGSVSIPDNIPTRTGYTFQNWNTAADNGGTSYDPEDTISGISADVTLYAIWSVNSYAVTISAGENGTLTVQNGTTAVTSGTRVDYDTALTITATPAEGYKITALTVNGEDVLGTTAVGEAATVNYTVTGATTIAATFAARASYTVSFSVPTGLTAIADMTALEGASVTLPTADAVAGYSFVGWMVQDASFTDSTLAPTLYTDSYTPTADVTLVAVYSSTMGSPTQYALLTDISGLTTGAKVLLVSTNTVSDVTTYYALGSNQKSNNREGVAVPTPVDNVITLTGSESASSLEIGRGETTTTAYTFKDGSGYLYAASSGSNYLRSQTTLDGNGEWAITLADNVATILAQGSYTHNDLRFNYNGGSPLFAAYESSSTTMKQCSIYVCQGSISYTVNPTGATTYTLTYDANTTGTVTNLPAAVSGIAANASVTLSATEPTRTGYTFGGWNTAADQNGDTYAAGASFTVTEDVTLYAIWTINSYAVTWTEPENGAITAALEDGTPVNNGDLVDHFNKINVTVTPAEGYVTDTFTINGYSFTSPKNWTVSSAVTIVATFRAAETFTVSFSVPTGLTAIADMTATEGTSITLPTADAVEGYTFAGWMVQDAAFADTTVAPTLYTGSYAPTANISLAAVYSLAVGDPMQYALLTDVNNLTAGLHVLLVGSHTAESVTTYYALGTTQNGNNRSAVAVPTPVNDVITLTGSEGASSLEVGMGVTTATAYTFKDGSGYLYAASSGSNYLRSETTLDANGEWAINLDANYVATILAQGANSRNDLRFNYNNGSPIFSAYSSTSTSTTIFKGSIYVSQGSITYTTAPVIPVTSWTVNFVANGATVYSYTVNDGETLTTIPTVPAKAENYAYWDIDLTNVAITMDYTVTAGYRLWGDANGDGLVTSSDVALIQGYVLGNSAAVIDAIGLIVADVNCTGNVNSADASLVQMFILGGATLPAPV